MPFGKHKGQALSVLPDDYLRWLSQQELRTQLRAEVTAEIARRRHDAQAASAPAPSRASAVRASTLDPQVVEMFAQILQRLDAIDARLAGGAVEDERPIEDDDVPF